MEALCPVSGQFTSAVQLSIPPVRLNPFLAPGSGVANNQDITVPRGTKP